MAERLLAFEEVLESLTETPPKKPKPAASNESQIRDALASLAEDHSELDSDFFVSAGLNALLPVWKLASNLSDGRLASCQILSAVKFSGATVFQPEAKLWLAAISRRLAGRQGLRNPYYGEVTRDIPFELFAVLGRMVQATPEYTEPFSFYSCNKKGAVISFTSVRLVVDFLAVLSGYSTEEVATYFKRKLATGKRKGHTVSIIVSDVKDFAFVYKRNRGKLTISFHFGEWKTAGFPQHVA